MGPEDRDDNRDMDEVLSDAAQNGADAAADGDDLDDARERAFDQRDD